MSIQFVWDKSLTVGNPDLDEQHQKVFELANSLSNDSDEGQMKRTILQIFKHLTKHFSDEENMMKEIGYPKRAEHQELHNELITKLSDIKMISLSAGEPVIQFKKFIFEWITDHIMNADKEYFLFQQKQ